MQRNDDRELTRFDPKTRGRTLVVKGLLVVAALSMFANAHADPASGAETSPTDWKFSISPYLWAAGIKGTTGTLPGLPDAKVDESFGDIFDNLQFSGMLFYGIRKNRFGLTGDIQYADTLAKGNNLNPLFGRDELRSKSFILSALGEYRLHDDGRSKLNILAGARLWAVDTELKLTTGLLPGRKISGDKTWVDPVVGLTGSIDVAPKTFLRGWAFVGGFGVASNITADLFAGVGYRITDSISSTLGYRWVKVDYDSGDFLYDVRQQGIATGLTFTF
jgi:opacity protein-like surface antigen